MSASKGYFITIEGIDGSGKTTLAERVKKRLIKKHGLSDTDVLVTCEPTRNSEIGKFARSTLGDENMSNKTRALLFTADRAHHVATVIAPALQAGCIVICDRYTESTLAYQKMTDEIILNEVTDWATDGLQPDLTLFLDFEDDVSLAYERINARASANERHVDKDKAIQELRQVQAEYRKMFVAQEFMCLSDLLESRLRPQKCVIVNAATTADTQDAVINWHLRRAVRICNAQRHGKPLGESVD